jgi:hypothetical protein
MTATSAAAPGGALNHFGRAALAFFDYRAASLTALIVVAIFIFIGRIRRGKFHPFGACVKVMEACGLIAIGLIVGCVFLLTDPPAVDELSHEARSAIGLITLILTIYFGSKTINDAYHHDE